MKKLFSFAVCVLAVSAMTAQNTWVKTPVDGIDLINAMPEACSPQGTYVVGQDQNNMIPMFWDTKTGEIVTSIYIVDSTDYGDGPIGVPRTGTFHSVSSNGIAVGSLMNEVEYVSHPIIYFASVDKHFEMYYEAEDAGGEGYGITADGSLVVGFYFDDAWVTTPCYWINEGKNRFDLPLPTEEQLGFPIDYASARYVSHDGSVILGYVQDTYNGNWVSTTWVRNEQGEYEVDPWLASTMHQAAPYDLETYEPLPIEAPYNPFSQFDPTGLSGNGEWVLAQGTPFTDDEMAWPAQKPVRINLINHTWETLPNDTVLMPNMWTGEDEETELDGPEFFGVDNDGNAVGRYTKLDPETYNQNVDAVVWVAGETTFSKLADALTVDDTYPASWLASGLSGITADGHAIVGYAAVDESGNQQAFKLIGANVEENETKAEPELHDAFESIRDVKATKVIKNNQLIITYGDRTYNVMGQVVSK